MKHLRRHRRKYALGGGAAALAALLTAGVDIYDRIEAARIAHIALDNRRDFECAVKDCRDRGGRWWRGDCLASRRPRDGWK